MQKIKYKFRLESFDLISYMLSKSHFHSHLHIYALHIDLALMQGKFCNLIVFSHTKYCFANIKSSYPKFLLPMTASFIHSWTFLCIAASLVNFVCFQFTQLHLLLSLYLSLHHKFDSPSNICRLFFIYSMMLMMEGNIRCFLTLSLGTLLLFILNMDL